MNESNHNFYGIRYSRLLPTPGSQWEDDINGDRISVLSIERAREPFAQEATVYVRYQTQRGVNSFSLSNFLIRYRPLHPVSVSERPDWSIGTTDSIKPGDYWFEKESGRVAKVMWVVPPPWWISNKRGLHDIAFDLAQVGIVELPEDVFREKFSKTAPQKKEAPQQIHVMGDSMSGYPRVKMIPTAPGEPDAALLYYPGTYIGRVTVGDIWRSREFKSAGLTVNQVGNIIGYRLMGRGIDYRRTAEGFVKEFEPSPKKAEHTPMAPEPLVGDIWQSKTATKKYKILKVDVDSVDLESMQTGRWRRIPTRTLLAKFSLWHQPAGGTSRQDGHSRYPNITLEPGIPISSDKFKIGSFWNLKNTDKTVRIVAIEDGEDGITRLLYKYHPSGRSIRATISTFLRYFEKPKRHITLEPGIAIPVKAELHNGGFYTANPRVTKDDPYSGPKPTYDQLVAAVQMLMAYSHGNSMASGWWDQYVGANPSRGLVGSGLGQRNFGELIALIHSEISEALEGYRKNKADDHLGAYENYVVELADALHRIFDLAGAMQIPLASAYALKGEYNLVREDHKPENRSKNDGKKF